MIRDHLDGHKIHKITASPQIIGKTSGEMQSLIWVKSSNVISTVGRNLTEPMEPEFQAFREGEISPCGRNDGKGRNDGISTVEVTVLVSDLI